MDSALKLAARAVLLVWRTTKVAILHREAAIPPAEVLVEQLRLRGSLRPPKPRKLDALHPLPSVLSNKRLGQNIHYAWLGGIPPEHTVIYSDGSKGRETGWGWLAYSNAQIVGRAHGTMRQAEVLDAEIRAASEAAKWAVTRPPGTFHFCIDNTAAIQCLVGHPPDCTQKDVLNFKSAMAELEGWSVQWSPGHMGIPGNKAADKEAKKGAKSSIEELPTLTYPKQINERT